MTSLTFGFSKKKDVTKLKSSIINEQEKESDDEGEIIRIIEENEIIGTHPVDSRKGPLVIPMIAANKWRGAVTPADLERRPDLKDRLEAATSTKISIDLKDSRDEDRAALMEIMADSNRNKITTEDSSLAIPLIMRNKAPEGFETDEILDVSIRPEEPDIADYEEVPIEQFGMAMLRGMGWKKGTFGKHKSVAPISAVARPKGLGLGADRSLIPTGNVGGKDSAGKDGDVALTFKTGAYCIVTQGRHRNLYGKIEGLDEDNAQLIVKLTLSGKSTTVSQYTCRLVTDTEYKRFSKYLNKVDVDDFKEAEDNAKEVKRQQFEESDKERRKYKDDRDREYYSSASKKRHRHKDDEYHKKHKSSRKESKLSKKKQINWLQNHLRVRIIDDNYKKGQYFKEKVIIEDVISFDTCICRTDEGRVLENLRQRQLETVIPKEINSYVKIVNGTYCGQLAEMLKKDKKNYSSTLQLLSDRDVLIDVSFDAFCEYTGNIDNQYDY